MGFLFLMVNVLLVTTIAGSIIPIANKLADGPLTVIDLPGQSIPGVAIFFILYVMLQALSGFPLMLLRPAPLILGYLKGKRAKTAFQDRAAWAPGEIFYGAEISKSLIIFHIGLIFSTIAPVILPICTVYYVFGYVAYKYNILYVHVNTFEAGGSFWPDMATRITWGLILFQLTIIGVFAIKESPLGSALLPLPILVVIFSRYVKRAFYLPTEVLPLGIASDIDNGRDAEYEFLDNQYVQPSANAPVVPVPVVLSGDQDAVDELLKPHYGASSSDDSYTMATATDSTSPQSSGTTGSSRSNAIGLDSSVGNAGSAGKSGKGREGIRIPSSESSDSESYSGTTSSVSST